MRSTDSFERADAWAVVLASQGISSQIVPTGDAWLLIVPAADGSRGVAALAAYEAENEPIAVPAVTTAPGTASIAIVTAALSSVGLVLFHGWLRSTGATDWLRAGAASASAIRSGELWRAVTALTLHADWGHVLSNALLGTLFVAFVVRAAGPGLGMLVVVAAGFLGNVANAWVSGPGHQSIGASTAVFGAVGILAGSGASMAFAHAHARVVAQTARNNEGRFEQGRQATTAAPWRSLAAPLRAARVWAPIAAGAALLGLLGSSEHTDVLAHLFGFAAGFMLGLPASRTGRLATSTAVQSLAGAAVVIAVIASWVVAMS